MNNVPCLRYFASIVYCYSFRILTGQNDFKTKGRIVDLDGKTTFGAWKPECDKYEI